MLVGAVIWFLFWKWLGRWVRWVVWIVVRGAWALFWGVVGWGWGCWGLGGGAWLLGEGVGWFGLAYMGGFFFVGGWV